MASNDRCSVALGHRRLAVIDVEGGAQPLHCPAGGGDEATGVVGVVNGEIYNFRALRRELEQHGHRFATRSDSEVVVHGYAQWGDAVLERLEGMFALAIWDARASRLLLARDRMGEKPLYHARRGDSVIFASELRALLRHRDIAPRVDHRALAEYLVYEYVPAPRTILAGVRKLAPGERLIVELGTGRASGADTVIEPAVEPAVEPYWDLPLGQTDRLHDLAGAAGMLRGAVERSVAERLVSDVPLGVFLSGGLDSSLIAALACRARRGIASFSLGFTEPSYDESRHARRVARFLGTEHHEYIARPEDALALAGDLGQLLDEPIGDASIVPTHLLARFAREHVTVTLSGDGGDELFDGYPTVQADAVLGWAVDRLLDRGAGRDTGRLAGRVSRGLLRGLRRASAGLISRLPVSTANFSLDFKLAQLARGIDQPGIRRHQSWLGSFRPDEVSAMLSPTLRDELADVDLFAILDHRAARYRAAVRSGPGAGSEAREDPRDLRMYFYCKGYLGDGVLTKVDRASMHASLEVRAPLLDRQVIALACRVAPALRSRRLTTKRVLQQAARGLVPDDIIDRPKHGFGMPLASWLRGPLAGFLSETLAPDRLRADGFFDPASVSRLVREHRSGRANHRKPLWTLLALHAWLDTLTDE